MLCSYLPVAGCSAEDVLKQKTTTAENVLWELKQLLVFKLKPDSQF